MLTCVPAMASFFSRSLSWNDLGIDISYQQGRVRKKETDETSAWTPSAKPVTEKAKVRKSETSKGIRRAMVDLGIRGR
jgi:hypothetical protein